MAISNFRPLALGTDALSNMEQKASFAYKLAEMRGTRDAHVSATRPRSMTSTEVLGSSLRRAARQQPAVPPARGRSVE